MAYPSAHGFHPRFAAIVPVGPRPVDQWRAVAVLESLGAWEPTIGWCVIVDDAAYPRDIGKLAVLPPTCRAVTLPHVRKGSGTWRGAVATAVLMALEWIDANTDADFVLKIDTDALTIGPFASRVRELLDSLPGAGLIGAFGVSCNPSVRAVERTRPEATLRVAARMWPVEPADDEPLLEIANIPGVGVPSARQRDCFNALRSHIEAAVENDYFSNAYCQGGAYVISGLMRKRLAVAGYLASARMWSELPFYEELALAMYASAVDLTIHDCVKPGDPFGVQWRGLPYPPEELLSRGYALIHSVKGDRRVNEHDIRKFFGSRLPLSDGSARRSGSVVS
jgi:hypothetical protein